MPQLASDGTRDRRSRQPTWFSLARKPICHPRFVVWRRSMSETALGEVNSFPGRRQPFCNIGRGFHRIARRAAVAGVASVKYLASYRQGRTRPGLTRRTLVSTLVQSPESRRYGCDPRNMHWGPRRLPARHKAYRGFVRAIVFDRHACPGRSTMPDATRRESWQRASGPSSRITGAVPACTASGCGCAPARDGRSCRIGAARAVAR